MRGLAVFTWLGVGGIAMAAPLAGRVVGIADGDTITVLVNRQAVKVRLTEIDTPEKGQPWGGKAKKALSEKVFNKQVEVRSEGKDRYGRTLGRVFIGKHDVNREMVREGHAWVYRQYMADDSLLKDEAYARDNELGLWSLPEAKRIPPWDWRNGTGKVTTPTTTGTMAGDFGCAGKRYCKEMTSCAEARFYMKNCGLGRLDGDKDGVPCEEICR